MATFQAQVESLTSLSVGTTPTTAEFTQFLTDGVVEVTNRWLTIHPEDRSDFTRVSAEQTSNGSLDLGSTPIITVVREDGVTSDNWRPCRQISAAQQYLVTDTDSLSYASKHHPVYMIGDNNKISVFPAPGSNPNAFKVYYVNNVPTESAPGSTVIDQDSTAIAYFPTDKGYLVALYAAMRTLQAVMGNNVISITAVPPDAPTLSAQSATIGTAPSYTVPTHTISGTAWATAYPDQYTNITVAWTAMNGEIDKVDDIINTAKGKVDNFYTDTAEIDNTTELWDNTNKRFTVVRDALLQAQNLIDNSEPHADYDAEANLADIDAAYAQMDAHLDDSETVIGADPASSAIQTAADAMKAEILLAAALIASPPVPPNVPTLSAQSMTITGTAPTYDNTIANTAMTLVTATIVEANNYIDVNEDVELAAAKISETQATINDASLRIQNELSEFNEENIAYQSLLQKDARDAAFSDANEQRKLQRYQIELTEYQAEVNMMVQSAQSRVSTAQAYSGEIKARMAWASSYSQAAAARGVEGNARVNQLKATLSVATQELQRANVAIAEINIIMASYRLDIEGVGPYLQSAQSYLAQATGYAQEVQSRLSNVGPKVSEYQSKMQNALNVFNDANTEYQAVLQKNIQNAQLADANEARKLQKYQSELTEYQSEVNTELQEKTTKMGQYQLLYNQIKVEYDGAFAMVNSGQQATA